MAQTIRLGTSVFRMLFNRRQRIRALEERTAAGEFNWTTEFPPEARVKIRNAFHSQFANHEADKIAEIQQFVLDDEGWEYLVSSSADASTDFLRAFTVIDDAHVPMLIEAAAMRLVTTHRGEKFPELVRTVLYEYEIGYDFVPPLMVPRESQELHEEVVRPALVLLQGRSEFQDIEVAYQGALHDLASSPKDAILKTATALQLLFHAVGAEGKTVGSAAEHARKNGILANHDEKLIRWLVGWVEADRSENGAAHNVSPASREDAWLAIHVVGALILRVVSGTNRKDG